MTSYRLVSFKTSTWTQRVAIVLREKKVDFELIHIESTDRPDWFGAIAPHGKVPVLQIGDDVSLFESNAISEYLDETVAPRLHPEDPIARAINRAWIDYLPTVAATFSGLVSAKTEDALASAREGLAKSFNRLEEALSHRKNGDYFNGHSYSLVDAGYAPFLQRYLIVEELLGDKLSLQSRAVRQWAEALIARPSTHTFSPEDFRELYLANLKRRAGIISLRAFPA